jgi:hypothetical protein
VLDRVPTGRLVVLGEPGAGKTMLMVRLVLDLLARRDPSGPVPFLASVASWDPSGEDLRGWLAARLVIDHPALADPPPANVTESTQAAALLASGLILPILDGLDEIPDSIRGPAITRINDALRPGEQLVATCRTRQYLDAVRPQDGVEAALRGAAAVQVDPLDADFVRRYLLEDAAGPAAKSRWDPVLSLLGTDTPVGQALSTPLMVGLARVIYNARPSELAQTLRDPAELCSHDLANRAAVEALLFDAFIPAAYRPPTASQWPARQAEPWLAFFARHLEQTVGTTDLAWWQLRKAVPRTVLGLAAGLAAGLPAGLAVGLGSGLVAVNQRLEAGLVIGLAFGLVTALVAGLAAGRGGAQAPTRGMRISIRGLTIGVLYGLCVGLVTGITAGVLHGPGAGLGAGLSTALVVGLASAFFLALASKSGDITEVTSPGALLARDRQTALSLMLVGGLGAGLAAGLWSGFTFLPIVGLQWGLWAGLVAGLGLSMSRTAWPSYVVAKGWLALHHRLPWPLMAFLADAHQRGVLRQVGAVYQFRHIELQHRLANTSGKIGSYYDVQDVDGNKHRVALVKVIDPAQSADQSTTPDNGERFIGAVFAISAPTGSPLSEDVNRNAAAIGSDGQTYGADTSDIAGYTNFDNGTIHVAQGETVTRSVTFKVPEGVKVAKVQWTLTDGSGSTVQWNVRR